MLITIEVDLVNLNVRNKCLSLLVGIITLDLPKYNLEIDFRTFRATLSFVIYTKIWHYFALFMHITIKVDLRILNIRNKCLSLLVGIITLDLPTYNLEIDFRTFRETLRFVILI